MNFLHRVFNMWKKSGPSTECIALFCGKLFGPAKRQVPAGSHQLAGVDDVFNAVLVKGDMLGDVVFYGRGAGKL